ncbi:hypothetical protein C2G38_2081316 [Gigaspora rosea]|uniref:Uncharacterized protein n=1 Tax=Gigaspora rosea TaxID=44941 RepID=A0A397VCN8_9GLOM|nr:hypothetical protein C2G38_2081316 [Gigaspora rosea]
MRNVITFSYKIYVSLTIYIVLQLKSRVFPLVFIILNIRIHFCAYYICVPQKTQTIYHSIKLHNIAIF